MPDSTLLALAATAASVGLLHTLFGPDHFVPFIAMARAGGWSLGKTLAITSLCGVAHVLSSVLLGLAGLAIGAAAAQLVPLEELRGNMAGWLLLGFGLAYLVWGLRRAYAPVGHGHDHAGDPTANGAVAPWALFLIFAFGPCEPLIPLLIYPAAEMSITGAIVVAGVFGLATLGTMLALVSLGYLGLSAVAGNALARYAHAACGAAIAACGLAVTLGL